MIRPFDLLDVPLVAQLENHGTPLSTDALTRGARPLQAALASFFSLHSRGEYTLVMPNKPAGFAQMRPRKTVPRIRSEPSTLSDLLDGGGNVLVRADEALDRINRILSDENIKHLSGTLNDIQAVTAELRDRKSIIADAERAVESVDEAAQQIAELARSSNALVSGDGRRSMAKLADAARDLSTMMGKLESPMGDFAITGLPQITSAIASLQQAVDNLDRSMEEVQQNPQGLLARPPAQEIEVKP